MKTAKLKSLFIVTAAALLICAMVAPALSDPDDEYKKLPGYVEFGQLGILDKIEPKVEIFLKGPLLKLAQESVKHEDPDLAAALAGIQLIRVHVYPLDEIEAADVSKETNKIAAELERNGWEMTVRVREKDEDVYIYYLPGKSEDIDGLVVMVVEDDDEAVFVNIVGNIDPEQVGRIGHSLHLDGLSSFEIHIEDSDDDDDSDTEEKKKNRTHK